MVTEVGGGLVTDVKHSTVVGRNFVNMAYTFTNILSATIQNL